MNLKLISKIPIIAFTALVGENEKQKCLNSGMDHYLSKPCDKETLYNTLDKYLK